MFEWGGLECCIDYYFGCNACVCGFASLLWCRIVVWGEVWVFSVLLTWCDFGWFGGLGFIGLAVLVGLFWLLACGLMFTGFGCFVCDTVGC